MESEEAVKLGLVIDTETLTGREFPREAIERGIRKAADRIGNGQNEGLIRDANGQQIGNWAIIFNDIEAGPRCPACGQPMDYCQSHDDMGDPAGLRIINEHKSGLHYACHPAACEVRAGRM